MSKSLNGRKVRLANLREPAFLGAAVGQLKALCDTKEVGTKVKSITIMDGCLIIDAENKGAKGQLVVPLVEAKSMILEEPWKEDDK